MPTSITHRRVKIVTLAPDESIASHCQQDDIALLQDGQKWWVHFVGENGSSETYDAPFESYEQALWTAKAAAEFSSSL
jgi:hypothetical protein